MGSNNVMEGYLELRHNKWLKSNRKYYFILTASRIVYFNSQEHSVANPSSPEGFFSLRDVLSVELSQKHKQSLQLNTTSETLVLKAKEDSVLWRWMGTIKENMAKVKESETKSANNTSSRTRTTGSLHQGAGRGGRKKHRLSKSFSAADQDVNNALRKIKKDAVEGRKPFGPLRPGAREARSEEDLLGGQNNKDNLEGAEDRMKRASGNSVTSRESLNSISRVISVPPGERVRRKSGNSLHSRESPLSGSSNNLKGPRSPRILITSSLAKSMVLNNECHMRDSLDYLVGEDLEQIAKSDNSAELPGYVQPSNYETNENSTYRNSHSKTEILEFEYPQELSNFNNNNNQEGSKKFGTKDDDELEIKPRRRNSLQPILKGLSWLTIRRTKKKEKDHSIKENDQSYEAFSIKPSAENIGQFDGTAVDILENNMNSLEIENCIDKSSDPGTPEHDIKPENEEVLENSDGIDKENNEKHYQLSVGESTFKHHRSSIEICKEKDSDDERLRTSSISSNIRTRTLSEASGQSDDNVDGGITENVKSKVSKWKQKSIKRKTEKAQKSSSKFAISGPIPVVQQRDKSEERRRILAEIDVQCAVEFTSKDIEDILNYPLTEDSKHKAKQLEDKPPELPTKPIKFQIRQLEMLQAGNIKPRIDVDELEVMLKLESLKVVANLDAAIHEGTKEENIYDTPRSLNLLTVQYITRLSMQSDSDVSTPDSDFNSFRPRITSISSRGSAGSYESTVILRNQL